VFIVAFIGFYCVQKKTGLKAKTEEEGKDADSLPLTGNKMD
jgi:hypothetical protein